MMRIPHALVASLTLAFSILSLGFAAEPNTLTPEEKAAGWTLLFDGKTLDGWRGYRLQGLPSAGWIINDGLLTTVAKVKGAELITGKKFDDFELTWEWRVAPGGNNGIKYFVTEDRPKAPGHEYQMLDDERHPDAMRGDTHKTAAFYDVLPPAKDKPVKPAGEWNASRIVVRGNHVEHWLNGRQVLAYELGSDDVKAALAKSKFKGYPDFGTKLSGHIMLTYHNDECSFRNIKIRELK
ncbi:MAG TPA: DUF1080 domain-containing protein [Verrucomicrobiae bacterium]|nr:DUF1080 domain-containing protein [Verrucomicrobiae bacterium]